MSQWGARALAEQGKSPEEIVKYWFKDVELKKLWK
jgi:stage II sporulation protein D